jgi:hypothetical protein
LRDLRARSKSVPLDFKEFPVSLDFFASFLVKQERSGDILQKQPETVEGNLLVFGTGF